MQWSGYPSRFSAIAARWPQRRWRWLLLALLAAPPLATAGGLQVGPIGLSLRGKNPTETLWLSNTGDTALHVQLRVFRWIQAGGEDRLQPSNDLLLSSPMLGLAPGERQPVRVTRTGPAPVGPEQAYRVLVDELPAPGATRPGLRFALRYSIPLFTEPSTLGAPAAELRARVLGSATGPRLSVRNLGDGHAQLAAVSLLQADGRRIELAPGLLGYALAGSEMSWPLPASGVATQVELHAKVNGENTPRTLPLENH